VRSRRIKAKGEGVGEEEEISLSSPPPPPLHTPATQVSDRPVLYFFLFPQRNERMRNGA